MRSEVREQIRAFEGVSLAALDERAALLRRVDNKYAVDSEAFAEFAQRLRAEHQVLEIDGERAFSYSTTYFDTPGLRCFVDHVDDRLPRFKARSRLYVDSGKCVFEVKLKRSEDETDKRQIDYAQEDRRRLDDEALECVRTALTRAGLEAPEDLEPTLTTQFARVTLAAREGSERLTCDFGVCLSGPRDDAVQMHPDMVLVETKSEDGEGAADRELARMGVCAISLSKYRVGMSLVGGARHFGPQPGSQLFN